MELIERLLEKQDLDASDAQALLQFLQERTASLLSRRGAVGSGLSTSRQTQGKSAPGAARKQHRVAVSDEHQRLYPYSLIKHTLSPTTTSGAVLCLDPKPFLKPASTHNSWSVSVFEKSIVSGIVI